MLFPIFVAGTQLQLSLHQPLRQPDLGLPQHVATEKRDPPVAIGVRRLLETQLETVCDTTSIIPMFQGDDGVAKTHPWPTEMIVKYMSLCKDVGSQLVGQAYACIKEASQRIWDTSPRLLHVCSLLGTNISHLGFWKILWASVFRRVTIIPGSIWASSSSPEKDMELIVGLFWEDSRFSRIYFHWKIPNPHGHMSSPIIQLHQQQQQQ